MQIINDYKYCPESAKSSVIALGNFDGMHKGHREIIKRTVKLAKSKKIPSAAMTFEPHPIALFKPDEKNYRITAIGKKAEIIANLGVDYLFVMKFNKRFSEFTAKEFIEEVLVDNLGVKHVMVGYDFIFGNGRKGNAQMLRKYGEEHGYGFTQIDAIGNKKKQVFSSTKVRENIRKGLLGNVKQMLGRNYSIVGRVKRGDGRGQKIGFPTINVDAGEAVRPLYGVYAVKVIIDGKSHKAVANIGIRPTFKSVKETLEIHIFDFDKKIYGANVEIEFIKYIRKEKKFAGVDELKAQIAADCIQARKILK